MDSIDRSCLLGESTDAADEHVTEEQKLIFLKSAGILPGKGPLSTMIMLLTLSERFCRTDHLLLLPRTVREFSLTRATLYRSLELLEQAGLVTVKRQKGVSPMVTFVLQPNATINAASVDRCVDRPR